MYVAYCTKNRIFGRNFPAGRCGVCRQKQGKNFPLPTLFRLIVSGGRRFSWERGADVENVTLVCIPASSAAKTETRYKVFAEEVARLTGCENGNRGITIEGERLAIHETRTSKRLQSVEVIRLDKDYFQGKYVLVFDDVLTQGHSYARFACELEKVGAEVLGGYFLGKTICGYDN